MQIGLVHLDRDRGMQHHQQQWQLLLLMQIGLVHLDRDRGGCVYVLLLVGLCSFLRRRYDIIYGALRLWLSPRHMKVVSGFAFIDTNSQS